MKPFKNINKPSKEEQLVAIESYDALSAVLENLKTKNPEIEIEETQDLIKIPLNALKLLAEILRATAQGKPISIVPMAAEMTTQAAAEFLGCSRPHLIKLLEKGEIPFTKVGKHRRIKFEDVAEYQRKMKTKQKKLLVEMIEADEKEGLYDS